MDGAKGIWEAREFDSGVRQPSESSRPSPASAPPGLGFDSLDAYGLTSSRLLPGAAEPRPMGDPAPGTGDAPERRGARELAQFVRPGRSTVIRPLSRGGDVAQLGEQPRSEECPRASQAGVGWRFKSSRPFWIGSEHHWPRQGWGKLGRSVSLGSVADWQTSSTGMNGENLRSAPQLSLHGAVKGRGGKEGPDCLAAVRPFALQL
jgi:hypothetical protein